MSTKPLDFTFDARVADRYDGQRAHPPEVSARVGKAIAAITGPDANILELGVGTGRIALPVAAAGCRVVGIDISMEMLAQLHHTSPELREKLQLVRGDITKLPFGDESFDAVTAVHVIHLVDDWQDMLESTARTLRPSAVFIMGRDWIDPESMSGQLQNVLRRTVMTLAQGQLKPPAGWGQIATKLEELGFAPRQVGDEDIVAAEWEVELTPAQFIEGVKLRTNPESWILSDEWIEPVVADLEAAAAEQWPGMDEPRKVRRRFLLTVFARQ